MTVPVAAGEGEGVRDTGTVERGMMIMALAMLFAPSMDTIAKWLSQSLSPGEISLGRFVFQALYIAPFVIAARRPMGARIGLQAVRGVLMAAAILCFFAAVQVMPLADCIAIFFVEPLVLTVLSFFFLGEPVGWRRFTAVIVGFAGALVVIQPSYRVFGIEAILPLGAAVCFAGYLAMTRRLVVTGDPLGLQFSASIFGGLAMVAALILGALVDIPVLAPAWPTAVEWLILAVLGAIAALAHLMIVVAFRMAPAGVLAPFHYLEIISATALGYLVFGDFPGPDTWIGVLIIVASGLYVFHRERLVARQDRH